MNNLKKNNSLNEMSRVGLAKITKQSLIILDWDDTLFPTSWISDNSINITDSKFKQHHIQYFMNLDYMLYELFTHIYSIGNIDIVIVTNAQEKWIWASLQVLPETEKFVKRYIQVISARDLYKKKVQSIDDWKKLTFRDIIKNNSYKYNSFNNIISIGDAKYEYNALIDLSNKNEKNRFLKTIRIIPASNYNLLLDQLTVLKNSINKICNINTHMDLLFKF
jgi:hypothetical protein